MILYAKTSEKVVVSKAILNADGTPRTLTGDTVRFRYKLVCENPLDEVVITGYATVLVNVVSFTLSGTDTAVAGDYKYEFWLDVAEDCIDSGVIHITKSLK